MNIWAHRGLSYRYPENTLKSFVEACRYDITGIELDIQLSKDSRIVVIHDETLKRTTGVDGYVKDYTLEQLQQFRIKGADENCFIPSIEEVFEVMRDYCLERGLQINIELKNSQIPYPGMEEQILRLVDSYGLKDHVVYSSFSLDSLKHLKELDPSLKIAPLADTVERCLQMAKELDVKVIHPFIGKIAQRLGDDALTVRAWDVRSDEPFFNEEGQPVRHDLEYLQSLGITDIFTNNCDFYSQPYIRRPDLHLRMVRGHVDEKSGLIVPGGDTCVNYEPVYLEKQMVLQYKKQGKHRLFFYSRNIPARLIYEYEYEPESNWSAYKGPIKLMERDGFYRIESHDMAGHLSDLVSVKGSYRKESIPEYFREELHATIDRLDEDALKFVLLSDTHYGINSHWQDSLNNITQLVRHAAISGIIHLGDLTDGLLPEYFTDLYSSRVSAPLKELRKNFFLCVGNHDFNYFRGNPSAYSLKQAYRKYLGRNSGNYYQDIEGKNLCFIFLESFDNDEKERYGFKTMTCLWLANILSRTPKDRRIIIFSHVPPAAVVHQWSDTIRNEERIRKILEKAKNSHKVLAWFCGHCHADFVYEDFPCKLVGLAANKIEQVSYKKLDLHVTPERKIATASQDLWDVLEIKDDDTLKLIRFGAGEDRII